MERKIEMKIRMDDFIYSPINLQKKHSQIKKRAASATLSS